MINALENLVDIQAHHTAEDRRDREQDRGHVDRKSHMREERAEHDAHRLTAADDAEAVKCTDEKHLRRTFHVVGERGKHAED